MLRLKKKYKRKVVWNEGHFVEKVVVFLNPLMREDLRRKGRISNTKDLATV